MTRRVMLGDEATKVSFFFVVVVAERALIFLLLIDIEYTRLTFYL